MFIKPSSALRNDYTSVSELAKATGEPIFITNKGEGDGVYLSLEAWEEREKLFRHRDRIYAAEMSRLSGEPVYTQEEVDGRMETLFHAWEG
jgi:PHD/YefM family antitoxin component YafN of YafNO toxin-antitoxin module